MQTFTGKANTKATILCDSTNEAGIRLTTFEIEYPRLILSEFNTHKMLSKNSASSRAIPFAKMIEQLEGSPARFGKNISGMQDSGEHNEPVIWNGHECTPQQAWDLARSTAINFASAFEQAGYHKQVFNRLTEPFQMMKTIVTGTEWANFFWLRYDEAADPTIYELAKCMKQAYDASEPQFLEEGQWHLPYIVFEDGKYFDDANNGQTLTLEHAQMLSIARCAAVSYRNVNYDLEKAKQVYDRLLNGGKIHGSAFEHCATPIPVHIDGSWTSTWPKGVSHMDSKRRLWSGNLCEWIQYRKLIDGENHEG